MVFIISFICNRLVDFLCEKKIIDKEEKDVYVYGYEMIFTTILGAVIVFSIAVILARLLEAIVFFVVFVLTRQFCGGYHANTRMKCSITFILCYLFVLVFSKVLCVNYTWYMQAIIMVPYFVMIIGYAPITNENKPIDEDEIIVNRRKSICISVMWLALAAVLIIYQPLLASTLVLTLLSIAMLMMVEILKRKE